MSNSELINQTFHAYIIFICRDCNKFFIKVQSKSCAMKRTYHNKISIHH